MATIEDCGLDEWYSAYVQVLGERGSVLVWYNSAESDGADEDTLALAFEIGALLDSPVPDPAQV